MLRVRAIYQGRVQNVGFRSFAAMKAAPLKITGFSDNLENGDALIEAQGSEENIDRFLKEILKGNGFIRIDSVDITDLPIQENETRFTSTW